MMMMISSRRCGRLPAPPDARRGETKRGWGARGHRVEAEMAGRGGGGGGGSRGAIGACGGGGRRRRGRRRRRRRRRSRDARGSAVHHHELPSDDPVPHRPGPDDAEAGWAVEREPLHSLKFFLFFWRKKKGERDRRRRGEKGKRAARIFSLSLFFSSYLARTSISQEKSKRPMISREEDIGAFVERDRAKRRKERKKLTCPPFFRSREEVEKKMKRANRGTANRGTANR